MTARSTALAALVLFLGVALVDACLGVDVTYVLRPQEASAVGAGFAPGDDPSWRHGVPVPGGTVRVLLLDRSRLVTPPEAPARRLYVLDDHVGTPVPARRLWFLAASALFLLLAGALGHRAWRGAARPRA